jgi:predicted Zn-ribbon and HTH transcriptional regulator
MDYNNIKKVSQPLNLKIKLLPHQLVSIYNMEKLEINNIIEKDGYIKETKIGINADLNGYGKTLSMIGLILRDKMEWNLDTPFVFEKTINTSNNRIKKCYITRFIKLPATLIFVSNNILHQWESELSYSSLKYKSIITKEDIKDTKIENYDVILISKSDIFNKFTVLYSDYAWKRIIFDEPSSLRIKKMKEIYSNFYWFLSGKPSYILQTGGNIKTNFIKSLFNEPEFNFSFEDEYKDIIIKNDDEFVKQSFKLPKVEYFYYKCFEGFVDLNCYLIENMIEKKEIRDIIYMLNIKKNNIININNLTCSICLDKINYPVIVENNCNNKFCGLCFINWLKKNNSCPLCRSTTDNISYIDNKIIDIIPKYKKKDNHIIDILQNKLYGKFLIYVSNNMYIKILKDECLKYNINITELNSKNFINIINDFKLGKINILICDNNIN